MKMHFQHTYPEAADSPGVEEEVKKEKVAA